MSTVPIVFAILGIPGFEGLTMYAYSICVVSYKLLT